LTLSTKTISKRYLFNNCANGVVFVQVEGNKHGNDRKREHIEAVADPVYPVEADLQNLGMSRPDEGDRQSQSKSHQV
jgi:hypothetical protein